MESVGAFPEVIESWESLGKMFSAEEDLEFSPHFQDYSNINLEAMLNPNNSIINNNININNINPQAQESLFHTLESLTSDHLQFLSQESSYSTSANSGSPLETYCFSDSYSQLLNNNNSLYLIDQCQNIPPLANDPSVNIGDSYNNVKEDLGHDDFNHLKRDADESGVEDKFSNPKKKPRVQKSKRSAKKTATKSGRNGKLEEEISNNNTSSYSSEDENESQEKASTVVNLNGKARASRGSATDPQSLYARKRRERINERLRILQNLVPNGTKVDISTMLEEAVHYVKFLQLQIKVLSSDDMWMYAPIAYNGMDIGLNHKLSQLV